MLELTWRGTRARVWLDDLPPWSFECSHIHEQRVMASRAVRRPARSAAVEVNIPTGGRCLYGGLAVTLQPAITDELIIRVPESAEVGEPLADSLAWAPESPYIGLPHEYIEGILTGLLAANPGERLGSGSLVCVGAAHGLVGSSIWVFERLSRSLVRILSLDEDAIAPDELADLLGSELSPRTNTQKRD